jgi:hypothetical protein
LRPSGRAPPVDGGFVVDGRRSFASGIRHSAWWNADCLVTPDKGAKDAPRSPPPEHWLVFFPAVDGELIDNWDVGGLRGRGDDRPPRDATQCALGDRRIVPHQVKLCVAGLRKEWLVGVRDHDLSASELQDGLARIPHRDLLPV